MNLTLNNGVEMPALGFGVFQTTPDITADAVHTALADRIPAHRHRRRLRQRTGSRRGHPPLEAWPATRCSSRPRSWISDYGYDQTLHAFDKSAGKLGTDQIDLLILHQALPSRLRPHPGGLPRTGDPARRRAGPGHRREQLHARAPRRPAGAGCGHARGQPGGGAPVLHPAVPCRRPTPRTGSSPRRGPRSAASPATAGPEAHEHLRGPGHRSAIAKPPTARARRRSCSAGTCRKAAASIPKSVQARAHRREHRRLRLRAHARRTDLDRRTRHRYQRGGPEPDQITLENFGRPIPESLTTLATTVREQERGAGVAQVVIWKGWRGE
jgi:hypothetical protein